MHHAIATTPARIRAQRIAFQVSTVLVVVCVLLVAMVFAGRLMAVQDIHDHPLQVGEAVSLKSIHSDWRPGYIQSISAQGQYTIRMGITREIASRPQAKVFQVDGTARLKRRKEDAP